MQYIDLFHVLKNEWASFEANKISGLKTAWLSPKFNGDKVSFAQQFSFAIPGTNCLSKLTFNRDEKVQLLAERYGGKGIGLNGGGARCGTFGSFQLKGIGANILAGDHDDLVHAYGGLDARSAICEVIFTNVMSKVLPIGVVDIYGIIFTGVDTAIDPITKEKCWGSILVREACVRPAHFLPAAGFLPCSEYQKQIRPDFARTKIVNQNLAEMFASPNEFIMFLGSFLSKCANQMAFARVARAMHSTLSPSNFSIDGRWLDLCLSTFLSGGENFGSSSIFYNEAGEPLLFCIELLYTYGKMNDLVLNPNSLASYYNEQLDAYCSLHLGYVFGLPFEKICDKYKQDLELFKSLVMLVINGAKYVSRNYPEPNPSDPIVSLILGVYISLEDRLAGLRMVEASGLNKLNSEKIINVFRNLIQGLATEDESTELDFTLRCSILAIKRAVLPGMFYLLLVDKEISELCMNGTPDEIENTIDFYDWAADWVFDYNNGKDITIYRSKEFHVELKVESNRFLIHEIANNQTSEFVTLSESLNGAEELFGFASKSIKGFFYKNYYNKLSILSRYLCSGSSKEGALHAAE
ncbi:hypothetical protein [Teredinibacter haidensis]|uniref:hypothetical protein n=1 Tax=Teredinibacter haidensis TaxID=2731755 RepID=UPI000948B9FB|nr:hypothetical protein [Teredinibacter haidensis]